MNYKLKDITKLNRFKQVDAKTLSEFCSDVHEVRLLPSSANYDWYASYSDVGDLVCNGEVITLGKARYANIKYFKGDFLSSNNVIIETRDENTFRTKFLYYFLLKTKKEYYVEATTYPKFDQHNFDLKSIPFYSIQEQDKIIDSLDCLMEAIDRKEIELRNLDELIKSRFIELFGDLERNSKNWGIKSFSEFAVIDTNMTNDFVTYADYPHIGIDSIEKNTGVLSGYRTIKEDNVISGKYLFTPEHIIYSKIRPNLNKVALPDFYGLCSADAYPILARENCNRIFLAVLMRSDFFLKHVLSLCGRANQPKVNKEQVQAFKSPFPPIELQNEFAEFFILIDKSKFSVQKEIDLYQELLDKKMNEYFG